MEVQKSGKQKPKITEMTPPLAVSVADAAILLGLGESTVYEMLDQGELPSARRGKRRVIPYTALQEWLANATRFGR
jgi:excisionase family DNA binding protein